MFKVNDHVMYGIAGICKIEDILVPDFAKDGETYYKLELLSKNNSSIYVRTDNEIVSMRKCFSKEEAIKEIDMMEELEPLWIEESRLRVKTFKEYLKTGDNEIWMRMAKGMYIQRKKLKTIQKTISQSDKEIMKNAEKLIFDEFAFALETDVKGVRKIINKKLG